jgi:hypothetical protein
MFFRRERLRIPEFSERVDLLSRAGFATSKLPDGRVKVIKHDIAAIVGDEGKNQLSIEKAGILVGQEVGILVGQEVGILVSGGYQMFFETPSGKSVPAMAEQLRALHQFEDDVKDALGLTNLYNTSLGTTSTEHRYDRVTKRDTGNQPKPWAKKGLLTPRKA